MSSALEIVHWSSLNCCSECPNAFFAPCKAFNAKALKAPLIHSCVSSSVALFCLWSVVFASHRRKGSGKAPQSSAAAGTRLKLATVTEIWLNTGKMLRNTQQQPTLSRMGRFDSELDSMWLMGISCWTKIKERKKIPAPPPVILLPNFLFMQSWIHCIL